MSFLSMCPAYRCALRSPATSIVTTHTLSNRTHSRRPCMSDGDIRTYVVLCGCISSVAKGDFQIILDNYFVTIKSYRKTSEALPNALETSPPFGIRLYIRWGISIGTIYSLRTNRGVGIWIYILFYIPR